MKKIITSAAVAAALTTAAFAAGTLTVDGDTFKVSKELLVAKAVDVNITSPLTYTAGIANSSANEPGFEIVFTGLTPSAKDLLMIDAETNATIATFSRIDGSSVILEAKATVSVNRNKTYKLVSNDSNASITAGDLTLKLPQGTTSAKAKLILTDNTGVNTLDSVEDDIISTVQQFSASVKTKFDQQIDSSKAFKKFVNVLPASDVQDTVQVDFINIGADLDKAAGADKATVVVHFDQNLSTVALVKPIVGLPTQTMNDTNMTLVYSGGAEDVNQTGSVATFILDGTTAMNATNFTASVDVNFETSYSNKLLDKVDAGKWDIYGYTAQIPNVTTIAGSFETVMKFTNKSDSDVEAYFTLRDKDGTVATVDTKDTADTLETIKKGATSIFKASDLLAKVTDAAFNKTTSFSVEVTIPTTPTNIYGFASFQNLKLGQFKDLPIYNSSTMSY